MNQIGIALLWSAARITLVALAAVALYGLAARRGPAARAWVATVFLGLAVLLPGLAVCPLPGWWSWDRPAPSASVADVPQDEFALEAGNDGVWHEATASSAAPKPIRPAALWDKLRAGLARAAVPAPAGGWNWLALAAGGFLLGAGLCVGRLLLGLWAVRLCCRRGRPVDDAEIVTELNALRRAMGCRRPVALYESAELTTAATVGWRRPVLLLPHDWRAWDEAERRAVLAHELAHVRRADYAAGLLARVGVALHFYHPLVRWLAGRLLVQQELAADALGAQFAGGRGPYLHALARLALRQEGPSPGWPARTFLPARSTLLRRIQMLRAKEQSPKRSGSRLNQTATVAVLAAVALAASALRGPAEEALPVPAAADTKAAPAQVRPAFDLSYVPPDVAGVFAVRPAEFFRQPGMRGWAVMWNQYMRETFAKVGMSAELGVPIEQIEQMVGVLRWHIDPKQPTGQRGIILEVTLLRTVKDFDWAGHFRKNLPGLKEARHADKVYYNTPVPDVKRMEDFLKESPVSAIALFAITGGHSLYVPDARTVVIGLNEPTMRHLLERKPVAYPDCVWAEGWKQVEHGVAAWAIDTHSQRVPDEVKKADAADALEAALLNTRLVAGVSDFESFRLRAFAQCPTEAAATKLANAAKVALPLGRVALQQEQKAQGEATSGVRTVGHDEAEAPPLAVLFTFSDEFLRRCQVEHNRTEVRLQCETGVNLTKALDAALRFGR